MIAVVITSSFPSWLLALPLLALPLVGLLLAPVDARRKLTTAIGVAAPVAVALAVSHTYVIIMDPCLRPNLPEFLWWYYLCFLIV
jgi:hypothetical protein